MGFNSGFKGLNVISVVFFTYLVFGVPLGLLRYCCIQYYNLVKNEVKMEENV